MRRTFCSVLFAVALIIPGLALVGFTLLFHAGTADESQAVIKTQVLVVLSSPGDAKHTGVSAPAAPENKKVEEEKWLILPGMTKL